MNWPELEVVLTSRCRLEPLTPAHADVMVEVLSSAELYEFTGGEAPTKDQLERRYRAQSVGHSADRQQWWCNWIVVGLDDQRPLGYVQATVEQTGDVLEADIAWVVRPQDQHRGLATEAAAGMIEWLSGHDVDRFAAYIHPEHAASARVAAKLGLQSTGEIEDGEIRWETSS